MKAFLSESGEQYMRTIEPVFRSREAIDEAKRILAETEKGGSYFIFPEDEAILVEALSLFVAE